MLFYALFLILSDLTKVSEEFSTIKLEYIPVIVLLAPASWLVLFTRWNLLLKNSNINIPWHESLKINLSGYALSVTPGKVGELLKSHFMKTKFQIPQKNVMPIVLIEQFYTFLGLSIVGIIGIWYFQLGTYVVFGSLSILALTFCVLSSTRIFNKFFFLSNKIPFVTKYTNSMSDSYHIIKNSLKKKIFFYSSLLSITFWLIESLLVYFIVLSFNIDTLEFAQIVSIYVTSIIFGLVSFLPLGIGVVEGSLASFFTLQGLDISLSVPLVIIIRIFTRWYGVSIGLIALKMVGGFTLKENSNP